MYHNIPPTSNAVKNTLWIGKFQAGKTTAAIKESYRRQLLNPDIISVFIAFGTNTNKENQEGHIRDTYKDNLSLINSREDLKAFKARSQRNELEYYQKYERRTPIVISALGHWATLEILQNILSTKSKFRFELWLDESDSYSKDFDKQVIKARKDNLIDSVKQLDYHQVDEIICITATPFTELVCTTDFESVKEIKPGEGYIDIDTILENIQSVEAVDLENFEEGFLSPELEYYISDQALYKNTVTIVTTSSRMGDHKRQAEAISEYLDDDKVLVVEFNSNRGNKYFSRVNPDVPKVHNRKDQLSEMFKVAKNYDKLFIVGGGMLDRSVTLKKGKFSSFSGVLFSAGRDASLPALLQRAARVCGYQSYVPSFHTDMDSKMYLANLDYPRYIRIAKENPMAIERRKALLRLEGMNYSNAFGRHRDNTLGVKSLPKSVQDTLKTKEEAEAMGYSLINVLKEIPLEKLNPEVLLHLQRGKKATHKSPLAEFIQEEFPQCNRILDVEGRDKSKIYYTAHLPNQTGDNFRDTLYAWDGETLTISNQPFGTYRKPYTIQHILTKKFECYNERGAFKFREESTSGFSRLNLP